MMKLKSAFFAVVLLLLTVTVCAAQSPMGFSPTEFYDAFVLVNDAYEGPEYYYQERNEEDGDLIVITDHIIFNLAYSANEVNGIYLLFYVAKDDQKTMEEIGNLVEETFVTMALVSGRQPKDIDTDELVYLVSDILSNAAPQEYCGYHFEFRVKDYDADGYLGALMVTKKR